MNARAKLFVVRNVKTGNVYGPFESEVDAGGWIGERYDTVAWEYKEVLDPGLVDGWMRDDYPSRSR